MNEVCIVWSVQPFFHAQPCEMRMQLFGTPRTRLGPMSLSRWSWLRRDVSGSRAEVARSEGSARRDTRCPGQATRSHSEIRGHKKSCPWSNAACALYLSAVCLLRIHFPLFPLTTSYACFHNLLRHTPQLLDSSHSIPHIHLEPFSQNALLRNHCRFRHRPPRFCPSHPRS